MAQDNWRWCSKCEGLFYAGNAVSTCPAGGAHDGGASADYILQMGQYAVGQQGWRWCFRCQGLYYAGNPGSGSCPAGNGHDAAQSGEYSLLVAPALGQDTWRWCNRCQGLYYAGNPGNGSCPAGGGHDATGSADYVLGQTAPLQVDFVAWHDRSSADHQAQFDHWFPLGYRFVSLSVYGAVADPLYAAIAIRRPQVVPQHAAHGLSAADFQALFDSMAAQGMGPTIISATGPASNAVFAAVFEPMSPIPLTRHGLTADEFAKLNYAARFDPPVPPQTDAQPRSSTTIPSWVDVYGDSSDRRYIVIYASNPTMVAWNADGVAERPGEYQHRFDEQVADLDRPALVSPAGDGTYLSLFREDGIGWFEARHELTSEAYQSTFDYLVPQGYFPLMVQGGGSGDQRRFAAVFTAQERPTEHVFTVTGGPSSTSSDDYDSAMEQTMRAWGVRQAALALVKGTRLVLARGYTLAEPDRPVTQPTTPFRQASCSKTITAILVHQLLFEGRLALSDTLQGVLDLRIPGGGQPVDARFGQITIEHILEHWSGLPTGTDDAAVVAQFRGAQLPMTPAQAASWAASQTLMGDPGTLAAWTYNNLGYAILGQVVAALRSMPFVEAVSTYVAAPLGLSRTGQSAVLLSDQPADEARYKNTLLPLSPSVMTPDQPLVPGDYGSFNLEVYAPSGGLSMAVVDMARVLAALNVTSGNPLLDASQVTEMFQLATKSAPRPDGSTQGLRGHGWDAAMPEPDGGWYAQKGGSLGASQSCIRHSTNDISMVVCWSRQPVGGDWYPDFPEVIRVAKSQDWGTTDLFPTYGMPSF